MADGDREITDELVDAFVRLARGDFSVRLPRNYQRDSADTLAFFVNLTAEELDRLLQERDRGHRELEAAVSHLSELFLRLAAGDFEARAPRTERGDPIDVLAFLFNNMAIELGDAFVELDAQRKIVEAILESMIDGVLLLDPAGVIRRVNGALARLLERPAAELVGAHVESILDPGEQGFAASLAAAVAQRPVRDRDTRFRTASGEAITLTVDGSPFRDAGGALVGIVLVPRDDRQLRAALAQLQMTDRLAAMGTVAAGVAHEINNPLAFVLANLDFIGEELDELAATGTLPVERREELVRALKASRDGATRVRQIVRDLKAFSRVDQDTVVRLDINKLVDASVGMIRNELRHHGRLIKEFGAVPPVLGNDARMVQVFLNLVQNAAQAIPEGNALANSIRVVTGTDDGGDAFVEIHDTGRGIPAHLMGRIFDAFFTTKPIGVGTGLGLSICHKIVTSMGGRIEVASEVGVGTRFRVVLPGVQPDAAAPARPAAAVIATPAPRRRLLVVDDEPEVGESVRRLLGRDHEVDVVTRGTAALALIEDRAYDLILCDLHMPDMTGMEVHARLVATRPEVAARVVFMTGGVFSPSARDFLDDFPGATIDKPFEAATLRALIATRLAALGEP